MIRAKAKSIPTFVVLLALIPGALFQADTFGIRTIWNILIAVAVAATCEALIARARGLAPMHLLRDGSACVTATLLALSLPPSLPVGVVVAGVLIAIGIGKHAFGGAGDNPFNPAMVGYAALLLSFPALMAAWPNPDAVDGITAPTALDAFKHRGGLTVADAWTQARGFGAIGGANWEWLNLGYLAGGIALAVLGVIDWRIPVTLLATLSLLAAATYDAASSSSLGSPLFHCFSGGTMLGAFFIATDPVTCPTSPRGRVYFAIVIGAVLFVIRSASTYPDGIAFAVLLANAAAPLIDQRVAKRS